MLQQTQVATVIPYYERFVRTFPTVERLAGARFQRVAQRWSGLGYYRRARQLHAAARLIVEEFGGRFPETYEAARSLPGVGHYTACAVLSMAYGRPLAVLDGNVARVISRLNAVSGNVQQARFRDTIKRFLEEIIPARRPGDFNQALMELGQTICLPRAPRCDACPVRSYCLARNRGDPDSFPEPRPRRKAERRHLAAAVVRSGGRFGLVRGLEEGLLGDLWNFPCAFGESSEKALSRLKQNYELQLRVMRKIGTARHSITFRSISVEIYETAGNLPGVRWFTPRGLDRAALSQLARKIAMAAQLSPVTHRSPADQTHHGEGPRASRITSS